jgi:hypothetical protein
MTVVVASRKTSPESVTHPAFLTPISAQGDALDTSRLASNEAFRWEPDKSLDGPVAILVSRTDARLVVLRNGIEIGRSRVGFRDAGTSVGTHVYVAKELHETGETREGKRDPRLEWLRVALPTSESGGTGRATAEAPGITLPPPFSAALAQVIAPGTTLMIMDTPILEHVTGRPLSILTSHPEPMRNPAQD